MPKEERLASGEIELYYEWHESGSGHREVKNQAKLVVDQSRKNIVLEKNFEEMTFIGKNSGKEESKKKYSISVKDLISFIEQNGKPVK